MIAEQSAHYQVTYVITTHFHVKKFIESTPSLIFNQLFYMTS